MGDQNVSTATDQDSWLIYVRPLDRHECRLDSVTTAKSRDIPQVSVVLKELCDATSALGLDLTPPTAARDSQKDHFPDLLLLEEQDI